MQFFEIRITNYDIRIALEKSTATPVHGNLAELLLERGILCEPVILLDGGPKTGRRRPRNLLVNRCKLLLRPSGRFLLNALVWLLKKLPKRTRLS